MSYEGLITGRSKALPTTRISHGAADQASLYQDDQTATALGPVPFAEGNPNPGSGAPLQLNGTTPYQAQSLFNTGAGVFHLYSVKVLGMSVVGSPGATHVQCDIYPTAGAIPDTSGSPLATSQIPVASLTGTNAPYSFDFPSHPLLPSSTAVSAVWSAVGGSVDNSNYIVLQGDSSLNGGSSSATGGGPSSLASIPSGGSGTTAGYVDSSSTNSTHVVSVQLPSLAAAVTPISLNVTLQGHGIGPASNATGNARVGIYPDDGAGAPVLSNPLVTGFQATNALPDGWSDVTFPLYTSRALFPGTTYWISLYYEQADVLATDLFDIDLQSGQTGYTYQTGLIPTQGSQTIFLTYYDGFGSNLDQPTSPWVTIYDGNNNPYYIWFQISDGNNYPQADPQPGGTGILVQGLTLGSTGEDIEQTIRGYLNSYSGTFTTSSVSVGQCLITNVQPGPANYPQNSGGAASVGISHAGYSGVLQPNLYTQTGTTPNAGFAFTLQTSPWAIAQPGYDGVNQLGYQAVTGPVVATLSGGTWFELFASTPNDVNFISVFSDTGYIMVLGTGGTSGPGNPAGTVLFEIPPGGTDTPWPVRIPAGTRVAIKMATGASAASGTTTVINFFS